MGLAGLPAADAHAQLCKLLRNCAPASPPPPPCQVGSVDANPANDPVAPALGERLLPRRPDGRLPWGFTEAHFGRGVGLSLGQRLYRKAGATVSRFALDWGGIEPERGGVRRWSKTDASYCAALSAGARPLLVLSTVPRWAIDPGALCLSVDTSCRNAPARTAYPELRRFAELAAIRYPQAAGIEVWNEPNAADFWQHPSAFRYTEVLQQVYVGVKNGRPQTPVIGGSLANHQSDQANGSIGIYNFLEGMYASGAAQVMDGLSLHPYPVNALGHQYEYFTKTIDGVRAIVEREEGPGTRRLWLTELGAVLQNHPTHGSAAFTGEGQAAVLTGTYDLANAMSDVDVIAYHTLSDVAGHSKYGWVYLPNLLGRRYPKPVFCAFAARFATPINCNQPL